MKQKMLPLLCLWLLMACSWSLYGQNLSTGLIGTSGASFGWPGNVDDTWSVSLPASPNTYGPAYITTGSFYGPSGNVYPYPCQPSTARWISPAIGSNAHGISAPGGTYRFRTTINVGCNAVTGATLIFNKLSGDNNVSMVWVNGFPFAVGTGFASCNNNVYGFSIGYALVPGSNTITIELNNAGPSLVALLMDVNLTINYGSSPSPLNPFILANFSYCESDLILPTGAGSTGWIQAHNWSIVECDQNGVVTPGAPGSFPSGSTPGKPGFFNPRDVWPTIPCGKHYKITLGIWNQCVGWKYYSRIIWIQCGPSIDFRFSTRRMCAGSTGALSVNVTGSSSVTVTQLPSNTVIYTGPPAAILVNPTVTTTYQATATDPVTGCTSTVNYTIYVVSCGPPIKIKIETYPPHFMLTADPEFPDNDQVDGFESSWMLQAFDQSNPDEPVYSFINPSCWQLPTSVSNVFEGVDAVDNTYTGDYVSVPCPSDAGKFTYGYNYKITRATWSDYQPYEQYSVLLTPVFSKNGNSMDVKYNVAAPDMRDMLMSAKQSQGIMKEETSIYPNPGNGLFHIKTSVNGKGAVEVYNIMGALVHSQELNNTLTDHELDLSRFDKGVYMVRIISGSENTLKKVVIDK